MHKGDKGVIPFADSIKIRFEKFDMSRAATEQMQGAVIEVTMGDSIQYVTAYRHISDGRFIPAKIPGTDISIGMYGLEADRENLSNSEAILSFSSPSHPSPPARPAITLDVSIKPFISFVWAGVIIMVGGFFFSILRRRKEIDSFIPAEPVASESPLPSHTPAPKRAPKVEDAIAARTGMRK
jgi:cytochrome c-type biogenesis protein CcmF